MNKARKQGKAEGRAEEKYEIARTMKKKNMDIHLISELTGLSEKDIRNMLE